jgi:hypothetical protein
MEKGAMDPTGHDLESTIDAIANIFSFNKFYNLG